MSQTFPGYSPPPIKQKSAYQDGSKSEQVPIYPLLCRNPRNAVINKKHATMGNLHPPLSKLTVFQRGPYYSGIKAFSNLPSYIKNLLQTKKQLKKALK